jgi:hypothetical protein
VKRLHRLLLAWVLMLALPLQGYAGTHMLMCSAGTAVHAPAPARVPPCHAHAAMTHADAAAPLAAHHADAGRHDAAKHGCAACSFVAAMAPGALPPLVLHESVSTVIPFRSPSLPSADPSLPDRPPRPSHA